MSKRRSEVRRADAKKLLTRIQDISVLGRESAGRGHAFDIGEQQASGRQRNNPLDILQPQRRALQRG